MSPEANRGEGDVDQAGDDPAGPGGGTDGLGSSGATANEQASPNGDTCEPDRSSTGAGNSSGVLTGKRRRIGHATSTRSGSAAATRGELIILRPLVHGEEGLRRPPR